MTLELTNNLTKNSYEFTGITDELTSRLFYTFDITLQSDMDDGEYSYTLKTDDGVIKATGLLQIGEYKPNNNTYTAQTQNGYIQYQSN